LFAQIYETSVRFLKRFFESDADDGLDFPDPEPQFSFGAAAGAVPGPGFGFGFDFGAGAGAAGAGVPQNVSSSLADKIYAALNAMEAPKVGSGPGAVLEAAPRLTPAALKQMQAFGEQLRSEKPAEQLAGLTGLHAFFGAQSHRAVEAFEVLHRAPWLGLSLRFDSVSLPARWLRDHRKRVCWMCWRPFRPAQMRRFSVVAVLRASRSAPLPLVQVYEAAVALLKEFFDAEDDATL
jgi:hypothetical protein